MVQADSMHKDLRVYELRDQRGKERVVQLHIEDNQVMKNWKTEKINKR